MSDIDPGTSRMLSERSTIWATPPHDNRQVVLVINLVFALLRHTAVEAVVIFIVIYNLLVYLFNFETFVCLLYIQRERVTFSRDVIFALSVTFARVVTFTWFVIFARLLQLHGVIFARVTLWHQSNFIFFK